MSAQQHIEWLSLVEKTGPFLAVGVLDDAFPQGLDKVQTPIRQRIRSAYEEWREAVDEVDPQLDSLHREWVRLVLEELLEYDATVLKPMKALPDALSYREPLTGAEVKPGFAVMAGDKARLLIACYAPDTDLSAPIAGESWAASPVERMIALCRATAVRVGLLTDGEQWTLVGVPPDGGSSIATWYARIWQQETVTLQAFVSLLQVRRYFGPADETLNSLFQKSLEHQQEVTDTLGEQVRRAVEVLVQALDRADVDRDRELLKEVSPAQLYEAGLTVMMRLVVLLCAEERKLLLLGEPIYDQHYAVSTLRFRLRDEKERFGDEVLERRHDAWSRLLAVFRAVFGGIEHETLRLPALGGSLFDPDRFPFLEGRASGTSWRDTPAAPLPIDNRTVLMLLTALQVLEQRTGALLLSYEALDVEQIGHVYEGLLERTVKRVPETTLGLIGSQKAVNPNVALCELEAEKSAGDAKLLAYLLEKTGRSESGLKSALAKQVDELLYHRVLLACGSDIPLADRIKPFSLLLRTDSWGDPLAYRENSFIVTLGAGRRETGTHYTPKTLTEPIVQHTLEPLVYLGPAEGKPQTEWLLKSPREILALKVCDMAMGSAAFLVQTCRWLGDRLVEAWDVTEKAGHTVSVEGELLEQAGNTELLPRDRAERVLIARRLIASRCLYGVDKNPMAVELAKVSLWLITMMKGRPFSFLDHALKCGDSLLGVDSLKQVENFSLRPGERQVTFATANLFRYVEEASKKRGELEGLPSNDYSQIKAKSRLNSEAETATAKVKALADCLIMFELRGLDGEQYEDQRAVAADHAEVAMRKPLLEFQAHVREQLRGRRPFHWPVEFPEVFTRGGFDAFVGNPPFVGNKYWGERLFEGFQRYAEILAGGKVGKIDVVALFFRRAFTLMSEAGRSGLIATTTAREGTTLQAGFAWLSTAGELYRAESQMLWPGMAGVHICIVWFAKVQTNAVRYLDGKVVEAIPPGLSGFTVSGRPHPQASAPWGSQGSDNSKGEGFLLVPGSTWFNRLVEARSPFLHPYLTGEDITNGTYLKPLRWCVDCEDFSLEEVRARCPETHRFLIEEARPRRTDEDLAPYPGMNMRWWQMCRHRASLYRKLRSQPECVAFPMISKHLDIVVLSSNYVFTNKVCALLKPSSGELAVLLSSFFESWVVEHGGTLRVGTLKIVISTTIETFPYPEKSLALERAGDPFYSFRGELLARRSVGLTTLYNCFHDPAEKSDDIVRLRALHVELDQTVATAYGWNDLDLGHGFHETKQGVRYTLSESARRTVLDGLLQLNHRRYAEEVAAGLHDKKRSAGKRKRELPSESLIADLL